MRFTPDAFTDFTSMRFVSFMPSYWHTNALCAAAVNASPAATIAEIDLDFMSVSSLLPMAHIIPQQNNVT